MADVFSLNRIIDILGAARSADEKRVTALGIFVAVDPTADRELIMCIKECLTAKRLDTVVAVRELADARPDVPMARDAAVFVAGEYGDLAALLAIERARRGIPCAIVASSALDLPMLNGLEPAVASLITGVYASNAAALERRLARWLLNATDKDVACAASFPFCRPVLASRLKIRAAAENALLGATGAATGSDFVVMTVNQAYLAFDLAAVYGDELSMQVMADLALVLTAATGARTAARVADFVLPFGTRFSRSVIAFAGTMAAARLVEARHDGTLEQTFRALADRATARVLGEESTALVPVRAASVIG